MLIHISYWHEYTNIEDSITVSMRLYVGDDIADYVISNYDLNLGYFGFCYLLINRHKYICTFLFHFIKTLEGGLNDSTYN